MPAAAIKQKDLGEHTIVARGGVERKLGRRRNTLRTAMYASELMDLRTVLDGMNGDDPAFEATLARAESAAIDMSGVSIRMDRDGFSRRSACERIMSSCAIKAAVDC